MSYETLIYAKEGNIATVTLNRPEKRNCMSPKLNRRMYAVLDELEHRADVGLRQRAAVKTQIH